MAERATTDRDDGENGAVPDRRKAGQCSNVSGSREQGKMIRLAQIALVVVMVVLMVLATADAVVEIAPHMDDYVFLEHPVGHLSSEYRAIAGPFGRPLGVLWLEVEIAAVQWGDLPVWFVVAIGRALSLALIFFVLLRLWRLEWATSVIATVFAGLTPPAVEALALLCNGHLQLSAPFALAACGMYMNTCAKNTHRTARALCLAAVLQVATYAIYEQSLLAIPLFLGTYLLVLKRTDRWSLTVAALSLAVACGWGIALKLTGYVGMRGGAAGTRALEGSDLWGSLQALWLGFAQHHLSRLVVLFKTGTLWAWDQSPEGISAAIGAIALAALIGWSAWRFIGRSAAERVDWKRLNAAHSIAIATACLVAAYGSILLLAMAYPGVPIYSRMYHIPGVFLGIASAVLLVELVPRRILAMVVALFTFWFALEQRFYLEDVRTGARSVRTVAATVVQLEARGADSILVIGRPQVGTFSSAAIEPWSTAAAVRERGGGSAHLFFTGACTRIAATTGIVDEHSRTVGTRMFDVVILYNMRRAMVFRSTEEACLEG